AHFMFMNDIDLEGIDFYIIGSEAIPFRGVFDGNGFVISNFSYTFTNTDNVGLFGYVDSPNAEIRDLGLSSPNVHAVESELSHVERFIGSLAGSFWRGTITRCYVNDGRVTGTTYVGGLVGRIFHGTITKCYSSAVVSGDWGVGGLVGCNEHSSTITESYVDSSSILGVGLVSGGVGGLVGFNSYSTIFNCYAKSSDVSGYGYVGGLVGESGSRAIANCYATCRVEGVQDVGGLVGNGGCAHNSFWDIQTSSQSTSASGKGRTTAQMQTASTFLGWDSCDNEGVWTVDEGNDYPRLLWENRPGAMLETQRLPDLLMGAGTEEDPYLICTAEELNLVGLFPCEWDKYFKLMSDIDLSHYTGTEFNIIGIPCPFGGEFDGNGKQITNLNHIRGLFLYVAGTIKDLGLIDANIDAGRDYNYWTGSLVSCLQNGTITGCYAEGGSVSADFFATAGGLVGENSEGVITDCYTTNNVTSSFGPAGGLVGSNDGYVTDCYSTGSLSGDDNIGGLAGSNYSTITNCYATGSVVASTTDTSDGIGGLVGLNEGGIDNCYSDCVVEGTTNTGGLVGYNKNFGTITNCYAISSVSGFGTELWHGVVGGLVGVNYDGIITHCYAAGSLTGTANAGGLVGDNRSANRSDIREIARIFSSFWDVETSDILNMCGGENNCIDSFGKTTAEMQTASTFLDAGWDFVDETDNGAEDIWWIDEGQDYPRLWWEILVD
ncbi:MAG: GLUG motif-containing protein, partial [Phycisphaerales bacterium]